MNEKERRKRTIADHVHRSYKKYLNTKYDYELFHSSYVLTCFPNMGKKQQQNNMGKKQQNNMGKTTTEQYGQKTTTEQYGQKTTTEQIWAKKY